jgi:hypothetical protein
MLLAIPPDYAILRKISGMELAPGRKTRERAARHEPPVVQEVAPPAKFTLAVENEKGHN